MYNGEVSQTQFCRVYTSCIHTPVNDVKEQISHGKYDSGVRVDHVAVAHDVTHVVFYCISALESGSIWGCGGRGVP